MAYDQQARIAWGTIKPIFLPSRSTELNPVKNIWQYMRANWISNHVFEHYDAMVEPACEA